MKTRKQRRLEGGKILGKGKTGTVLTIPCTNTPSFCGNLQSKGSAIVRIFTLQNEKYRLQQETYEELLELISTRDDIVVKRFSPSHKVTFRHEMNAMRSIYSSLGKAFVAKYTAYTILSLKNKDMVGFQIGDTSYFLNKRCNATLLPQAKHISPEECKYMIQSILNIVKQFQKKNLYHNDIKMDNIIKCGNNYILIDMEKMLDYDAMKRAHLFHQVLDGVQPYGSMFNTSPFSLYLYTGTLKPFAYSRVGSIPYTMVSGYPFTVTALREYLDFYEKNMFIPAQKIVQRIQSSEQLFEQYHQSFDTHSLGATVAQLYFIQRGALPDRFLEFAKRLVNPLHPEYAGTAKEALALSRHILDG